MPKIRSNSSAKKRFLVGGSGTIKRGKAFKSHNTGKKTPKRTRQLRGYEPISSANIASVRGMLPYAAKRG